MLTRCAVVGHPVAHSLSPVLHRAAYSELGLDWTFERIDVTAAGLPDLLASLTAGTSPPEQRWRGLALTMPLKRAVLPLLDSSDETVQRAGAANTLLWEPDGSRRGANTDVPGLVAALREAGPLPGAAGRRAVVLGGGATAASTLLALAELGVGSAALRVRDPQRVDATRQVAERCGVSLRVEAFGDPWSGPVDVLVATVPSEVAARAVPDVAWQPRSGEPAPVVVDVSYDPWPSPLLERAARTGARTVSGIDLLAHQAVGQLALMTGHTVAASLLRTAALATLRT